MPPKKRGAATKRKNAKTTADEPDTSKLKREDSENTKLKKAIDEIKSSESKTEKKYKPDQRFEQCVMYQSAGGGNVTIYEDYCCMLNQTDIGKNNNKFYIIQLGNAKKNFYCYTRWGRVGEVGAENMEEFKNVEDAIKLFEKKFKDKTKNNWADRQNFQKKPGKYELIDTVGQAGESDDSDEDCPDTGASVTKPIGNPKVKCQLDPRTQLLIKLIFADDMFKDQMAGMNLNVNKMPLGKLSKVQIAKGLEVLIELETAIKSKKGTASYNEISSKFYTIIPHAFGRSIPTPIDTIDVVTSKKEMMMTLSDIELTMSLRKDQTGTDNLHPLDAQYQMLNAKLDILDKKSDEFKLIKKFAVACPNTRKGSLLDAWRVDRDGEAQRFATHDDIKYRKLLWHGTNCAVVAAILKAGLRIMPHSGGRVGKGLYFASEHSKSSWYVGAHYGNFEGEKDVGFMFLVEVALGNMHNIKNSDGRQTKAPNGYDSIVARGCTEPDPKADVIKKFDDHDVIVPIGKPIKQKEYNDSNFSQSEYLIYKESQAKIRYILKFSFSN